MNPDHTVLLKFNPSLNPIPGKDKNLTDGLSVIVQIGNTLWVANDEALTLERLTLDSEAETAGSHEQFFLGHFLNLPDPLPPDPKDAEEVDLEGLALADGYLWLIGSHSLKRKLPKPGSGFDKASERLAKVESEGNRYLLARIPVDESGASPILDKKVRRGDGKTLAAAQLHGGQQSDALTEALKKDKHIALFMNIPSKDNGFDVEGLAAVGKRLFIGLRGPVLRGWAVILEIEPEEDGDDLLKLKSIGPDDHPSYHKHFLQLGGLGVRDLCVDSADVLILAGPTMDLDGPVKVFRWPGGANPKGDAIVEAGQLQTVLDLPYGEGNDHAEGISLFNGGDIKNSLIVVYDAAPKKRQPGQDCMLADVFPLS